MKTKHLLTGLVLPALFAACTAEEIETSKGVITQEDLSARPAVGSVVLNFGEAESRADLGESAFNAIEFNEGEDAIGARIIDSYTASEEGTYDADEKRVAWADYTISDFASSNYQYVYNGKGWETTALMVEGNYMFYYPYNKKNVVRGALEIITPTYQTVKPNEKNGDKYAIAELYAGENPAFVGYKFIAAENQGLVQTVDMQHVFAYPQITLVNNFETLTKKNELVGTDLTITKVVFSADNLFEKYTVDHDLFRKALTPEFSYLAKATDKKETPLIAAGVWTDTEKFLKNATITDFAKANDKKVEITVEFEGGLELGYGEEYVFNVVMPALAYDKNSLSMKVYTEDDMMIGIISGSSEEIKYFTNGKSMSFAPGKRYATQEYNFPTTGNPTPKKTAGNVAVYELEAGSGETLDLIEAVAPVAVINDIDDFEAYLKTINRNVDELVEISEDDARSGKSHNFILTKAYNEKGVKQDYANLSVNEELLALLDEYNYAGNIEFITPMHVYGAKKAADKDKGIEEFALGNKYCEMTFGKLVVKEGYVTVNGYTAADEMEVEAGLVTVSGAAAIDAATVKGGELKITSALFDPATVTASHVMNEDGDAEISDGKVTLSYTGETAAPKVNGGTLTIGSNVKVKTVNGWEAGDITNNGTISAAVTIAEDITLTNNGKMTGTTITNNGTIETSKDLTVTTNNGKIKVLDNKVELTVSAGTDGEVDNTISGKVTAHADQDVYAILTSLTNDGEDTEGTALTEKYDWHSGIDTYVLTGAWNVYEASTLASVSHGLTTVYRNVKFASGSSLYVANGAVLTIEANVVIAANVNWTGRDATTSEIDMTNGTIEFEKTDAGVYYNVTTKNLGVTGKKIQEELLKQAATAGEGGTLTLTESVALDNVLNVAEDVTINLNGKTIKNATAANNVLNVTDGTLTINGTGTVQAINGGAGIPVYVNGEAAKVVINNGSFKAGHGAATTDGKDCILVNDGEVEINGGTFETYTYKIVNLKEQYSVLNFSNTDGKYVINAGTFKNFNPASNYSRTPAAKSNFVAEGKIVKVYDVTAEEYRTGDKPASAVLNYVDNNVTFEAQPYYHLWSSKHNYIVETAPAE